MEKRWCLVNAALNRVSPVMAADEPAASVLQPQTFLGSATGMDGALLSRDSVVTVRPKVPLFTVTQKRKRHRSLRDATQPVVLSPLRVCTASFCRCQAVCLRSPFLELRWTHPSTNQVTYTISFPFIHLSIHPSTNHSINGFIHTLTFYLIHPSTHPHIVQISIHPHHQFTYLSIQLIQESTFTIDFPLTHPSTGPSIHSLIHPPKLSLVHQCTYSSVYPLVHSSIHSYNHPSIDLCFLLIHIPLHSFIHSTIHPFPLALILLPWAGASPSMLGKQGCSSLGESAVHHRVDTKRHKQLSLLIKKNAPLQMCTLVEFSSQEGRSHKDTKK